MDIAVARRTIMMDLGVWADRTIMHEAASLGRVLQLKQLIDSGSNINILTVDNITPLHDACMHGNSHCVRLLLQAGAQIEVRNIHGSTALCHACAGGNVECVRLLLDYGAEVNPTLTALTSTPLHEACSRGNVECVKLLISKGALLETYDVHFGTPLHLACAKGHTKCARELLNAGANVNGKSFHNTALHHAAESGSADLIELLVEFGGDINASDNLNKRPLDYTPPESQAHLALLHFHNCPLSLQQICRIRVRSILATRALMILTQLNLCPRILNYLCYD
ncbi:ankyrin repeat and SOCS box protein 13a.1 isoform X1 [Alosa sapidissima]|uniref:ankyrin repeat and SOCS box protein 13a.1 isoform X1 n=2 Tax=Alosa sapidissima TaxID=34773 RepID=UPI001C0A0E1E|nr:ankyrin repeat and SOCS box protein 13a.1 isoform X1 [Alosa sapidissima]